MPNVHVGGTPTPYIHPSLRDGNQIGGRGGTGFNPRAPMPPRRVATIEFSRGFQPTDREDPISVPVASATVEHNPCDVNGMATGNTPWVDSTRMNPRRMAFIRRYATGIKLWGPHDPWVETHG